MTDFETKKIFFCVECDLAFTIDKHADYEVEHTVKEIGWVASDSTSLVMVEAPVAKGSMVPPNISTNE